MISIVATVRGDFLVGRDGLTRSRMVEKASLCQVKLDCSSRTPVSLPAARHAAFRNIRGLGLILIVRFISMAITRNDMLNLPGSMFAEIINSVL
jgi:hypothetical protein